MFVLAGGLVVAAFAAAQAVRSAIRLNRRIGRYRKDQSVPDPYAVLAEIYAGRGESPETRSAPNRLDDKDRR